MTAGQLLNYYVVQFLHFMCFACIHEKNSNITLWSKSPGAPHLCLFYKWWRWFNLPAVYTLPPVARQCNKPKMPLTEIRVKSTVRIGRAGKRTRAIKQQRHLNTLPRNYNQRKQYVWLRNRGRRVVWRKEDLETPSRWSRAGPSPSLTPGSRPGQSPTGPSVSGRQPEDLTKGPRLICSPETKRQTPLKESRLQAGQEERRKLSRRFTQLLGKCSGCRPRLWKSPAAAPQQRDGKRCSTWPRRRKTDDARVVTAVKQQHAAILNFAGQTRKHNRDIEIWSLSYEARSLTSDSTILQAKTETFWLRRNLLLGPTSASKWINMTQMMNADDDVLFYRTWASFPGRWTQFPLHHIIMTMIIIIIMMIMIIHHIVGVEWRMSWTCKQRWNDSLSTRP